MAPARSKQQFKFFKEMEERPEEAKKKGISQNLAHEYTDGITKEQWKKLDDVMKKDKKKK